MGNYQVENDKSVSDEWGLAGREWLVRRWRMGS